MAPTICCRGDVPSNFRRRHEKQHPDGSRLVPHPIVAKEGDTAPHIQAGGCSIAEEEAAASLRGGAALMSAASTAPRPAGGGALNGPPFHNTLVLRKVGAVRRKRRRGATWYQRRAASSDDDVTSADSSMICSAAAGCQGDEGERSWVERCSGPLGTGGWEWRTTEGQGGPKGLLGITVRTVELMRRNQLLQWRLSLLQEETRAFVQSVLNNPENRNRDDKDSPQSPSSATKDDQDPAVSGSC